MSQAQVPHWGLVPQARKTSDGRRAPARTAASTSRSRMARQMQTYMDVSTPVYADATYSQAQDRGWRRPGQAGAKTLTTNTFPALSAALYRSDAGSCP